jgi:hypothetical protein
MLGVRVAAVSGEKLSAGENLATRMDVRAAAWIAGCGIAACPTWQAWQWRSSYSCACQWLTAWVAKAPNTKISEMASRLRLSCFAIPTREKLREDSNPDVSRAAIIVSN